MPKNYSFFLVILQLLFCEIATANPNHTPLKEDPITCANDCYFSIITKIKDAAATIDGEVKTCKRAGTKKKCEAIGIKKLKEALDAYKLCLRLC